jgi:hypothetical protein
LFSIQGIDKNQSSHIYCTGISLLTTLTNKTIYRKEVEALLENPEALTILRRKVINKLNIRTPGHLPCQPESARGGLVARFFHLLFKKNILKIA